MINPDERQFFLEHGYYLGRGVLEGDHLAEVQAEFDRLWEEEKPRVSQHQLLKHRAFIDLIEHPPILDRHRAIFGSQVQLLQYDLLRQGPNSDFPLRAWHRDFVFPGDYPVAINTILFLDDITEEVGPTRVVPGTHRGTELPPPGKTQEPLPGEVAVHVNAGDAIFINGAIWHTGGRNTGNGLRRGIYLYYGYWWLKRYDAERAIPYQALEQASEQRLRLLGIKNPIGHNDIHQYRPDPFQLDR